MFPWTATPKQPETPHEKMVRRLSEGIPPELASRAAGIEWGAVKDDADVIRALAEGEILLFERARDASVTGTIRAAMRRETNTWTAKAEPNSGGSLEDLLRE